MKFKFLLIIFVFPIGLASSQAGQIDSVTHLLSGCWKWDYFYGGFAGLPPQSAWMKASLKFSRDSQDSLNQTLSYRTYLDTVMVDSGRTGIGINPNYPAWYYMDDVLLYAFSGFPMPPNPPIYFRPFNDSVEFTHFDFADDFYYVFGRDSCISDTASVAPDTTSAEIDSLIHLLKGCWRWDFYEGGFAGLPPTPAWSDVRLHFEQDGQDSVHHTVTCRSYEDSVLQFSGRCDVVYDSIWAPFFILSCPIFDSIGIVGYPPLYIYFEGDTMFFPQEQFIDGFVYAFLPDSCLSDTIVSPPDTNRFETIDSIIQLLDGCWKWDSYFGGFAGMPPAPALMDVRIEFSQDAQDSIHHTLSCSSYLDSSLKFSGRCSIDDSTTSFYYLLSCPLFDSIGIVGSPPVYFNFQNDTLLFPQEQFVDGYVYAFLKNCVPDDTTSLFESKDEGILLYPNPASERLAVILKNMEPVKISLFSSIGQHLSRIKHFSNSSAVFDLSRYPQGNYFIRIETSEGVVVKKFIIQR